MIVIGNGIILGADNGETRVKSEIIVTAKAGALLNMHYKDSEIILQSYQLGESETKHSFFVSILGATYVVDDVTNSISTEVLVDAVAQYSITFDYKPSAALFWYGDKCTELSGGWNIMSAPRGSSPAISFDSEYMIISNNTGGSYNEAGGKTANRINLSPYSRLYAQVVEFNAKSGTRIMLTPNNPWPESGTRYEFGINATGLVTCNISSYTDSLFVSFIINTGTLKVSKVWLE